MDSLKSLMDRKEYDLVLRLTKNADNPNDLFYRISAFLGSGKYQEALDCIKENRPILQKDLLMLMHVHIEILCILGRFDEAFSELEYYKNLPYESQQVEELLKELPNYIRAEEKKKYSFVNLDEDELIKKLKSEDQSDVLMAIDSIRNRDINPYLSSLEKVMMEFPKQSIRSFALLLLVQKQTNHILRFNHMGNIINVNPSQLTPPFVGEEFNDFVREISSQLKDPSLSETAIQILSSYIIYIYPDVLPADKELLLAALEYISHQYLQSKKAPDIDEICLKKGLDKDQLEQLIGQIEKAMDNF